MQSPARQSLARFLPVNTNWETAQPTLEEKYQILQDNLRGLGSVVIGFSGGADSALLTKSVYKKSKVILYTL